MIHPQTRVQPSFQSSIGKKRGHSENCNKTKDGGVGSKGNIDRDDDLQDVRRRPPQQPERPNHLQRLGLSRPGLEPNWQGYKH